MTRMRRDLVAYFSLWSPITTIEARRGGDAAFVMDRKTSHPFTLSSKCRSTEHTMVPLFSSKQPLDELASTIDDDKHESIGSSSFYNVDVVDVDDDNDVTKEDDFRNVPELLGIDSIAEFDRDEDEILSEREARFYIDERGERRNVEKCILVGVEDLSARRRWQRQQQRNNMMYEKSTTMEAEDMLFTLEESLTEMRELIKTAGMECVGGESATLTRITIIFSVEQNRCVG